MENSSKELKGHVDQMLAGLNGMLKQTEGMINSRLSSLNKEDAEKMQEAMRSNDVLGKVAELKKEMSETEKLFKA